MKSEQEISKIASLIGDKTRTAILIALMEGRALTAGELALRANISPQTASNHLKKLMDAELIELIKTPTRHRYYKISSPLVANALESLSILLPEIKKPPRHEKMQYEICFARICYDHLAGKLGVTITDALLRKNYIERKENSFITTKNGEFFFNQINIDCQELIKLKRHYAKPCLDWTEREYHLAGSLGSNFLEFLLNNKLLIRSKNKPRVIHLTPKGQLWIEKYLG